MGPYGEGDRDPSGCIADLHAPETTLTSKKRASEWGKNIILTVYPKKSLRKNPEEKDLP